MLLAIKRAPREIQGEIRKHTRALGGQEWQQALAQEAMTRLEHRVLVSTARVTVSNQNIRLSSATVGKKLRGGLNPKTQYGGVAFGGNQGRRASYTATSRRGRSYQVRNRRTQVQLRPFNRTGYVFYPAAAGFIPRVASLWAQTTVRTFCDLTGFEAS